MASQDEYDDAATPPIDSELDEFLKSGSLAQVRKPCDETRVRKRMSE